MRAAIFVVVFGWSATAFAHGEPCTSFAGDDPCPPGETCTVQDGGPGICLSPPCQKDDTCLVPLPYCELDPRSIYIRFCVECTALHPDACATKIAGKRCLLGRARCGCATNDDCVAGETCDIANVCQKAAAIGDAGDMVPDAGPASRPVSGRGSSCSAAGSAGFPAVVAFAVLCIVRRRRTS